MSVLTILLLIFIPLIIIILIVVGIIYATNKASGKAKDILGSLNPFDNLTTDCDKYGAGTDALLGGANGPQCSDPSTEYYAGFCYKKCPTGLHRTAVCSCENKGTVTDCSKYGSGLDGLLGGKNGPKCDDADTEDYGGFCYKKCPSGYTRTAVCTCTKGELDTNCSKYGSFVLPGKKCPSGYEEWGGLCYTDQCTKDGGTRTASATCDFGKFKGTDTNCKKYSKYEDNKPCPRGSKKTALCTCQKGGIVTDFDRYSKSVPLENTCPSGSEYFLGFCYSDVCPTGTKRTAACTCAPTDSITDCSRFGSTNNPPKTCPSGREYYASSCVKSCPSGMRRTAACTCSDLVTDCDKYGSTNKTPDTCPAGREFYNSTCPPACPEGTSRTAACTCEKP